MTYQRLAYDEASTPAQMTVDAQAATDALHLPEEPTEGPGSPESSEHVARRRRAPFAVTDDAATLVSRFVD